MSKVPIIIISKQLQVRQNRRHMAKIIHDNDKDVI